MLMFEKSMMGFYLDKHPTDWYKADLKIDSLYITKRYCF